ncbi:MAG: NUDIX domain-containing protein [Candidatus Berkiella sp.]
MIKPLQVTVNIVAFALHANQLCVLLVKNAGKQTAMWHLPESLIDIEQDHSLEEAAKRALKTPSGLEALYLEQVQTKGSKERLPDSWSVAVVYYALVRDTKIKAHDNLCWIPVSEVLSSTLAFDHQTLIEESVQRFQNKSLYTSLPIFLLPKEFTLTEVQKAYETVLGFNIEKKSLRRRLLDAHFLQETGNIRRASNRPAQLYGLASSQPYFFARIIEGTREQK